MADTTTPEAEVETTDAPEIEPEATEQDGGKGGKDAVLADLAKERAKRKESDAKLSAVEAKLAALATALGVEVTETVDPDALASDLAAQQRENAVLRAGAALKVNTDALLDSHRFTSGLADVDPTDRNAVTAYIEGFMKDHPQYAPADHGPAFVRDAAAVRTPTHKQSAADEFAAATAGF